MGQDTGQPNLLQISALPHVLSLRRPSCDMWGLSFPCCPHPRVFLGISLSSSLPSDAVSLSPISHESTEGPNIVELMQDSRKRKAAGVFVRGWGVVTLHPHLHTPSLSSGGIKALHQPLSYTSPP